jgi:hypothetical protein
LRFLASRIAAVSRCGDAGDRESAMKSSSRGFRILEKRRSIVLANHVAACNARNGISSRVLISDGISPLCLHFHKRSATATSNRNSGARDKT